MLTIFGVPKLFAGHTGVIQGNAIRSWTHLSPDPQIILFGDEPGTREAADELGVEQISHVDTNDFGTPLLSSVFELAQEHATSDLVCYVNADIILLPEFLDSVKQVSAATRDFLMVGSAWDLDVTEEIVSSPGEWEAELRASVEARGNARPTYAIDYFVFPRGAIGPLPPFAVGRPEWDNWMIYRARSLRIPVVDVSSSRSVIHQQHQYDHVQQGTGDRWEGPEAESNRTLVRAHTRSLFTLDDATHVLTPAGLVPAPSAGRLRTRVRTELRLASSNVAPRLALRALERLGAAKEQLKLMRGTAGLSAF